MKIPKKAQKLKKIEVVSTKSDANRNVRPTSHFDSFTLQIKMISEHRSSDDKKRGSSIV